MQIIDCEQLSQQWFDLRALRLTASKATEIGNCGTGLKTVVKKMFIKHYSSKEPEHFKNKHTDRGNMLEPLAIFAYETEKKVTTEKIGFIIHNDYVGVSPDRGCGEDGLCEVKARDDDAYWDLLTTGKLKKGDLWQIQMQLLVSERKWCDSVYYNPNFKQDLIITRIFPDEEMFSDLEKGFKEGEKLIRKTKEKMDLILK